jgi:protein-S-isoprenylcysteine O-methyltransferase Ste14
MSTFGIPNGEPRQNAKRLSVWLAVPLALIGWEVLPWAVSLLAPYYGWIAGLPRLWNLIGLIPVLVGTAGLLWGLALHSAQSPEGIECQLDKSYLLMRGPYAYSRHPMYLSELTLLLGWVIFYGSVAVLVAFLAWLVLFVFFAMPVEERVLEAHFGEAYRAYKARVPRWLGLPRR